MKIYICMLLIVCFLVGCAERQIYGGTSVTYGLNDDEIPGFEERALSGDVGASIRLANYHFYVSHDISESARWYSVASQQGNMDAALNLADIYSSDDFKDLQNLDLATSLYEKAIGYKPGDAYYGLGLISNKGSNPKKAMINFCMASIYSDDTSALVEMIDISLMVSNRIEALVWAKARKDRIHTKSVAYRRTSELIQGIEEDSSVEDIRRSDSLFAEYLASKEIGDDTFCQGRFDWLSDQARANE